MPIIQDKLQDADRWLTDYSEIPDAEINQTQNILDSLNIFSDESTLSRITKISAFLLGKFSGRKGVPNSNLYQLSPYQQYSKIVNNESKGWCGTFAWIYDFFSHIAGIDTRMVGINGNINNITLASHAFVESFVPELNKWVQVDLASNRIFVLDKNDMPLNTYELLMVYTANMQEHYKVLTIDTLGNTVTQPYDRKLYSDSKYFRRSSVFVYPFGIEVTYSKSFIEKMLFYITPHSNGYQFSMVKIKKNYLFYIKYILLYSMFIAMGIFIVIRFRGK